ncbi:MAG: alpha/beta hydrolase [Sulfurospirillum sp.]|nr:MAG: alpha/beta hydrolase [Sulfurospirillum sp.]
MLENESFLFDRFLSRSEYCVAGFSLGAIEALEYAIGTNKRVDRLLLFSPAFFQDKDELFKTSQIKAFKKNEKLYQEIFFKNISHPSKMDLSSYYKKDTVERLKYLLNYQYSKKILKSLESRGVKLEVFIGLKDKIIDPVNTTNFFQEFATITQIKEGGHILWID